MKLEEANFIDATSNTEETLDVYKGTKRILDITFCVIALMLLSPIFIIVGMIVKCDSSKGEIFFKQTRVGLNGKVFNMYKFRSMHPDAEEILENIKHLNEVEGLMFKIKDDPRVTSFGRFIRAYSIDELPQLFNVIKGDMSLIGPRPPLVSEFENYSKYDKLRLTIRPGITGLWQVSGRNSLTFSEMVALDLKYIQDLSFLNDLKIFLKTFVVVIKKENAY